MKLNYGQFQNEKGDVLREEPGPGEAFPICCGTWPNEHPHALQRMCSICGDAIGLSPKGWAFHQAFPEMRPLCCRQCFDLLVVSLEILKRSE